MNENSNNSNLLGLSSATDSEWVSQNVQGVMFKIIEEVKGFATKEADISQMNHSDLIALIQDFNQKHQILSGQCDILIDILHGHMSATKKVQNFDKESIMLSPSENKGVPKFEGQTISFDSPPNSGSSGSSIETKVGSEFSSLLSDFETDSFLLSEEKPSNTKLDNYEEAMNKQNLPLSLDTVVNNDHLVSKIGKYEEEIAALKDIVRDSETENAQLLSHNGILSMNLRILEARYAENEVKIKSLENELKKCEAMKAEMKDFHQTQDVQWHNITHSLTTELNVLNKNFDELKLKYDILVSDNNNLNTKLQTLNNEISSKDMKIQQAESKLHQLQKQNTELNASFGDALKQKDDLVEELEKELKEQSVMILNRAEEKREAIRQLCFSLEHYRSGYHELHKVCIGQRRPAMAAK